MSRPGVEQARNPSAITAVSQAVERPMAFSIRAGPSASANWPRNVPPAAAASDSHRITQSAQRNTRVSPPMPMTSNAAQVLADLKALVASFGFTATIEGKTLGNDLAGITADSIARRSLDDESGAAGKWADNAPSYREWKAKKYGVDKPNVRTGQMLSVESLLGTVVITTDQVQLLYGTGRPPTRSATGMGFDPSRDDLSDVEKALFCSKTRPFYELDDTIADACFDRIELCVETYLRAW